MGIITFQQKKAAHMHTCLTEGNYQKLFNFN